MWGGNKKRPAAWPSGAVQSATCGLWGPVRCSPQERSKWRHYFASDVIETALGRCQQCGVAASPPYGDKQLPAVTASLRSPARRGTLLGLEI